MLANGLGRLLLLFGHLSFGTADPVAVNLLLFGWLDCNQEIMSASSSGFVCRPTSLLPGFCTVPGILQLSISLKRASSGSMLSVWGRKGWPIGV